MIVYFCEISIKTGFPLFEFETAVERINMNGLFFAADQKRAC